jgi:hypothetical protein
MTATRFHTAVIFTVTLTVILVSPSVAQVHVELINAASAGDATTVKHLLDKDTGITAEDCSTAILAASASGHDAVVTLLLPRVTDKKALWLPLGMAASFGHATTLRLLLQAGADPNAKDVAGGTALMVAAENGHVDCVTALIAAGAQVGATNTAGETALTLASKHGHTQIVRLLQEETTAHPELVSTDTRVKRLFPAISTLTALLGKQPNSKEVTDVLAALPFGTPCEGHHSKEGDSFFYVCRGLGLVLWFDDNALSLIRLYGKEDESYVGEWPAGLRFTDTRRMVEKKLGEPKEPSDVLGAKASYPEKGLTITYDMLSSTVNPQDSPIDHVDIRTVQAK